MLSKTNEALEQELQVAQTINESRKKANMMTGTLNIGSGDSQAAGDNPSLSIGVQTTIASISNQDGILVLNNSTEIGLQAGAPVTLIHNYKPLGRIQIMQVTDKFAVANILPGANYQKLDAGESVKLLL